MRNLPKNLVQTKYVLLHESSYCFANTAVRMLMQMDVATTRDPLSPAALGKAMVERGFILTNITGKALNLPAVSAATHATD